MLRQDRPLRRQPEEIAVLAFSWLANEPEQLETFLAVTGLTPASIREASRSGDFLIAVAEHVVRNESLLVAFAAQHDLDPARTGAALCALAGLDGG